jgi:hypothetical protein
MITFRLAFAYILSPYVEAAKNGLRRESCIQIAIQGYTESQWPTEELRRQFLSFRGVNDSVGFPALIIENG